MQFFAPVPGRDGRTLFAVGWKPQGELVRYDPTSGLFVPFLGGLSAHEVDFSRDGEWIVYTTYPEGSLWRSRVDGSRKLQLTFPPVTASIPRISPDGSRVVFASLEPGQQELHMVPAAGGASRKLPITGEASWSPDGRQLAIGTPGTTTSDVRIRILDVETNEISDVAGSDRLTSPRWSPDGRSLVALSADASRLMLHDLKSGNWRVVFSAGPNGVAWPNWSRDGRHVFVGVVEGMARIRTSDGASEVVSRTNDFQSAFYHFGSWAGVTPDGAALALRNASVNEIFALGWEGR
jgi:WD40 repeat protein